MHKSLLSLRKFLCQLQKPLALTLAHALALFFGSGRAAPGNYVTL